MSLWQPPVLWQANCKGHQLQKQVTLQFMKTGKFISGNSMEYSGWGGEIISHKSFFSVKSVTVGKRFPTTVPLLNRVFQWQLPCLIQKTWCKLRTAKSIKIQIAISAPNFTNFLALTYPPSINSFMSSTLKYFRKLKLPSFSYFCFMEELKTLELHHVVISFLFCQYRIPNL